MYSFFPELLEHAIEKTSVATAHRNTAGRKTWKEGRFTAITTTITGEKLAAESEDRIIGSSDLPLFRSSDVPITQSPKLIPTERAVCTMSPAGSTRFKAPQASAISTEQILVPRRE